MADVRLLPMTPDLFAAEIDPTVQNHFDVDKGEATAMVVGPLNGAPSRTAKD